jgi:hypothetical protein
MSSLQQLFTSRKPYNSTTFIAGKGKMFYDEISGALRVGDGETPGGSLITYPVATSSTIGGIKLGPGVVLNGSNQIIIDSTGLEFSFGDFASTIGTYTDESDYAVLQTINTNEDMVLASNGTGGIHIVGELRIHATNGALTSTLESEPGFRIKSDGQIRILVPDLDVTEGAVTIVGSSTGEFIAPVNTGVMLHITGNYDAAGIPSRIYNDSQNAFGAYVTRRFNGTVLAPTAVLADQEIMRISGTAHNGTIIPGTGNQRIIYKALGNQTLTNQGGSIELWTTPINTTSIAKIATVDSTGITLESGKVLTGNVTGTATTATYAQSFNTGTLVSTAVLATTATNAAFAYSFNTGTLVSTAVSAVSATTAGTVTTAAQPAITSVGTLTSLTVTDLVTAKNYSGQVRNLGTITAGAGTEITIDFATDHMVRFNYSTEPVQVGFTNYSAGKTVTLIAINTNAANRQLAIGIAADNTQGVTTLDINGNTTGIVTYYCTGATVNDVFASTVYVI